MANGTVKVGDLGLGRYLSEQTMEAFSKVGTPLYMSPEVLKGKGYDWKSDVWSLGCILYAMHFHGLVNASDSSIGSFIQVILTRR